MTGETELSLLLNHLAPKLQPGVYVFCTIEGGRYRQWVHGTFRCIDLQARRTRQNEQPRFVNNAQLALGYDKQTKSGNSCTRTFIDANGLFPSTGDEYS